MLAVRTQELLKVFPTVVSVNRYVCHYICKCVCVPASIGICFYAWQDLQSMFWSCVMSQPGTCVYSFSSSMLRTQKKRKVKLQWTLCGCISMSVLIPCFVFSGLVKFYALHSPAPAHVVASFMASAKWCSSWWYVSAPEDNWKRLNVNNESKKIFVFVDIVGPLWYSNNTE